MLNIIFSSSKDDYSKWISASQHYNLQHENDHLKQLILALIYFDKIVQEFPYWIFIVTGITWTYLYVYQYWIELLYRSIPTFFFFPLKYLLLLIIDEWAAWSSWHKHFKWEIPWGMNHRLKGGLCHLQFTAWSVLMCCDNVIVQLPPHLTDIAS